MSTISTATYPARVGANRHSDGTWEFLLWAPNSRSVSLHLLDPDQLIPMQPEPHGYHRAAIDSLPSGARYLYRLEDERELPDPASRFQPEGVHKASVLVDTNSFRWTDHNWKGIRLDDSIFYELHVGTYTPEGTFDALIPHLPDLVNLGITVVEIMPVAQFPGSRNWGYDGVYPFATQNSYGGPDAFHRFVDAAHAHGLAVALDVVYNHLGPEGNYLGAFGPYFTDRYRTPWGDAINYDGEYCDDVRRYFIENALYWLEELHVDALRLDAIHGIFDFGARHFLAELKSRVDELSSNIGCPLYLIAESDLNDNRLLHDAEHGGYALDSQWSDDFHHSIHTLLTQESRGYYADFGGITHLAATLQDGWCYRGQYSAYRKRRHGNSPEGIAPRKFVVCSQNHDQVGNRATGDRLSTLVNFEALKLAAGTTLLSPFLPLLFMGEEYGEPAPFQYFTSHADPTLVEAVRQGRREEFAAFGWHDTVPDPQNEQTYHRSHLNLSLKQQEPYSTLYRFYEHLIRLREELGVSKAERTVREAGDRALLLRYSHPRSCPSERALNCPSEPALSCPSEPPLNCHSAPPASCHSEQSEESAVARTIPAAVSEQTSDTVIIFNFADSKVSLKLPELPSSCSLILNSASRSWNGPDSDLLTGTILPTQKGIGISPYSFLVLKPVQSLREVV